MRGIILCTLLLLISCKEEQTKTEKANSSANKLNVIATNFPLYDFAREVGGDLINLKMLQQLGASNHHHEPSPKDIIDIQNADVFLFIGGDSDEWVRKILSTIDSNGKKIVNFSELIEEHGVSHDHGHGHNHNHGHGSKHEHNYDEHIWTSPKNAALMAKRIAEIFSEKDTVNKNYYMEKNIEYVANLTVLDSSFTAVVKNAKHKTIIFGDRFPFKYFADEYGLKHHAAFPGCSHDAEPSAQAIAFLINKIPAENIPVVFHIELSSESIANTISEATGTKKMLLHSAHNVSEKEFSSGESYLSLMRKNVEALRVALTPRANTP